MRKEAYLRQMATWEMHLQQQGYAETTVNKYRYAVLQAFRELKDAGFQTAPSRIGTEAAEFVVHEVFKRRSCSIAGVKHYLKWCGNPVLDLLEYRPAPQKRTNISWLDINAQEDFIVWEHCDTPLEIAMVHYELHLGHRRIEVRRSRLPWYDGQTVKVHGKGRDGGKWRVIPAHKHTREVAEILTDHHRAEDIRGLDRVMAFKYRGEERVPHTRTMDYWLKRVGKRCGITVGHHTLRRTCGRLMYKAGVPLVVIRDFLGHTSLDMTIRYLGISLLDMQEAMDQLTDYNKQRIYNTPANCTEKSAASPLRP